MKQTLLYFFVLVFCQMLLNPLKGHSQLNYSFAASSGTFTAITGATTIVNADVDDGLSTARNIGFSFSMGCNTYTQFKASSNGWMSLGTSANNAIYQNALATTGSGPILAPLWDDMATLASTGKVSFVTTGSSPNRVLTVEWLNIKWDLGAGGARISFQVKLYETTNIIEFIYRQETGSLNTPSASIGLSGGTSATDFYSLNGSGASPGCVYGTETNNIAAKPATNQMYRFTPNVMVYSSTTVTQPNTSVASKCDQYQEIVALQIVTTGGCASAISVSEIRLNMNGSTIPGTNTNDVDRVRIYYTGTTSTYSPINEFVSGGIVPAPGTLIATGSQSLSSGTNYFWIVYNINGVSATTGNLLDAQCTQATIGGIVRTPTVTSPAGNRAIGNCTVSPGGVSSSLAFWIKSNSGTSTSTNGSLVSTWDDQSGNGRNATAPNAAQSPTFYDNNTNNINFYPVVDFDDAAQSNVNGDYMDISSNNILATGNNPYVVYSVIKPMGNNLSTPGKFLFSGNVGPETFNAFDIRSGYSFNDSWNTNDLIISNKWTTNYPSLSTFSFSNSLREMFISGTSEGTLSGSNRASTNEYSALGVQRSAASLIEFFDGNIAEIVTYPYTTHTQATRYKVESYLAIKYGMTLSHDYISSLGVTIWNRNTNATYNNNIIGLARDDNSALNHKQSKTSSVITDMLRLYIGPSKQTNQASNTGSFTGGDQSYFIAAHNNDPYVYAWSTPEKPAGIVNRLRREWLSQKTNFTNTDLKIEFDFNVISPGYSALLAADIRLLVDSDGDFSNASILGSPAITVTVSSGVVTVLVAASNFEETPYFTLGTVANTTPLPVQFTSFNAVCENDQIKLNWSAKEDGTEGYNIERSSNGVDFKKIGYVISSSIAVSNYTWKDPSSLSGISYYRIRSTDRNGKPGYTRIITVKDCRTDHSYVSKSANGQTVLNISLQDDSDIEIYFYDYTGRSLSLPYLTGKRQMDGGSYQFLIQSDALPKGVYLLSLSINGVQSIHKVMN